MGCCTGSKHKEIPLKVQSPTTSPVNRKVQAPKTANEEKASNEEIRRDDDRGQATGEVVYSEEELGKILTDPKHVAIDIEKHSPKAKAKVLELTLGSITHAAFILAPGYLFTTHTVLPTPSDCSRVTPALQFRPDLVFYSDSELNFSIVALDQTDARIELQADFRGLRTNDIVEIYQKSVMLQYIGEYWMYYKCEVALPGTPVLHLGKVVGMHESKNQAVSIAGIRLALRIRLELAETSAENIMKHCFLEDLGPTPSPFSAKVFNEVQGKLVSFDVISHKHHMYTQQLPTAISISYYSSFLFLTGGFISNSSCTKAIKFDGNSNTFLPLRDMANARARHSACISEEFLFVISGLGESGITNECERYNIKKNQWLPIYPVTKGRVDAGSVSFNSLLYVYGGCGKFGVPVQEIEQFTGSSWIDLSIQTANLSPKAHLSADSSRILIITSELHTWNLTRMTQIKTICSDLPGDTAILKEGLLYVFSGVKVLEARLASSKTTWKTYDNECIALRLSQD